MVTAPLQPEFCGTLGLVIGRALLGSAEPVFEAFGDVEGDEA
jgi:hypothetical protein